MNLISDVKCSCTIDSKWNGTDCGKSFNYLLIDLKKIYKITKIFERENIFKTF